MPTWRDRLEKAKKLAREKAPEVQARAEEAAQRARVVARKQGEKGRERLDQKRAERQQESEKRERWFETAAGEALNISLAQAERVTGFVVYEQS